MQRNAERATRLFIAERSNARERTAEGDAQSLGRLFYARQKSRRRRRVSHPTWSCCAASASRALRRE